LPAKLPAWRVLLLALATLGFAGCGSHSSTPAPAGSGGTRSTATPSAAERAAAEGAGSGPLLADWPTPKAALILSGEQAGYLEPCGCTAGQKGGLDRRYVLTELLKKQGWNLCLLDLGTLINDPNTRGGPEQTKIRFDASLKALNMMAYDALALSAEDLAPGVAEMLMRMDNALGDRLKVLAANVTPQPGLGFEKKLLPSLVRETGGTRIGVTAVLMPQSFADLKDADKDQWLAVQEPQAALGSVLAELESQSDFQVLMVQGKIEDAKNLASAFPGFDIVLATSIFADPPQDPEPLNDGKTWLIQVGRKGQYVGALGLYPGEATPMRYRRLVLGTQYSQHRELAAPMKKLLDVDIQADLQAADVLGTYPRRPYMFGDKINPSTFVGAITCRECHPNTYAKWQSTKHSHAYEPLENPERNREWDADCVRCHTTGFEYQGGFVNAKQSPWLKGNQCENCHGPGSLHVADPDNPEFRKLLARTVQDAEQNHRCSQCHDEDNDPAFKFPDRYSQIMHKGLDRYDNPKVHKGITPRTVTTSSNPMPDAVAK
jgi:hypothetical protein